VLESAAVKLFLPHGTLETWAVDDRADVKDGWLSLTGGGDRYAVEEAVHFKTLVSGPDEHKLAGKVKTQAQLSALGAEVMSNSAIAGESAYDVETGYRVEVKDTAAATPQKVPGAEKPASEEDLLARFLLNKL
jgi:hypothetical protein